MFGNNSFNGSDANSPPFKNYNASQTTQNDDFAFNRNNNQMKNNNNFGMSNMSFSKNFEEEKDFDAGSSFFKRGNESSPEGQGPDTLFNLFTQSKLNLQVNQSIDFQQQRQKTLSFQGNDSEMFQGGSGFNQYMNDNAAQTNTMFGGSPAAGGGGSPRRSPRQRPNQQKDMNSEEDSPQRQLSPTHQLMLKKSLEQLTPNIIDQGLKVLRSMNETNQSKPLASPSVIYNHCIDEEEIVQNIRGIARELKNILQMEKDLDIDMKEKFQDKDEITIKKLKSKQVFSKLYKEAEEKNEKQRHQQLEKEREIEVMINMSAVNKKSEQILKEKKNYVKIQERVDSIIQQKQMKLDQASFLKKQEEISHMKKTPMLNKNSLSYAQFNNFQANNNYAALDYSQSTENNAASNPNPQKYSEKSFTLSQLEFNPNNQYGNNNYNKGYTKKQLDEFLVRNERKKQVVHEQILERKLEQEQKEMSRATFHPKINKKSEQIIQTNWEPIEERIEKMQEQMIEKRKKQSEDEFTRFSYSPLINRKSSQLASKLNRTPLNKSYNNLNRSLSPFNKSFNQTQDLTPSRMTSSRKTIDNRGQASRPNSSFMKSNNQSTAQINSKGFYKNDSQYNISSVKDKNNSMNKLGLNSSQIKFSQMDNQSNQSKSEKVNVNDLQKEDYLINYSQQYMLNKDPNQKLNTQNSMQSIISKTSSTQQNQEKQLLDSQKQFSMLTSQQLKQRSRSSISINKQNEVPKPPNPTSKNQINSSINQTSTKVIPINKDNKFLLNMMNKKR